MMRKTAHPAARRAEAEAAKVAGKTIRQDQQDQRGTARRVHRQQSKGDGEDNDGSAAERPRRMLSEEQLLAIVPLSRSSIWRLQRAGKFPPCTYISANKRIWFEDEIIRWQREVDEFNPHRGRGPGRPKKDRRAAREQSAAQS